MDFRLTPFLRVEEKGYFSGLSLPSLQRIKKNKLCIKQNLGLPSQKNVYEFFFYMGKFIFDQNIN